MGALSVQSDAIAAIDVRIAADRALYLKAIWAGHDGEADYYIFDVQRLQTLRAGIEVSRDTAGPA